MYGNYLANQKAYNNFEIDEYVNKAYDGKINTVQLKLDYEYLIKKYEDEHRDSIDTQKEYKEYESHESRLD